MSSSRFRAIGCLSVFLVSIFCGCSRDDRPLANEGRKGLEVSTLDELVTLDEDELDIATVALVIAKQFHPEISVEAYRGQIDEIAFAIRTQLKEGMPPYDIASVLASELFEHRGFHSLVAPGRQGQFLHSALDQKTADCINLMVLYLAIGERLGIEMHGVAIPRHNFVRVGGPDSYVNLDAWLVVDDDYYHRECYVPDGRGGGFYLDNLSKRESLAIVLMQYGTLGTMMGEPVLGERTMRLGVQVSDRDPNAHFGLAFMSYRAGIFDEAITHFKAAIELSPLEGRLHYALGRCYKDAGDVDRAIDAFRTASSIDQANPLPHDQLASLFWSRGMYSEAIAEHSKILEVDMAGMSPRQHSWLNDVSMEFLDVLKVKSAKAIEALKMEAQAEKDSEGSLDEKAIED